jgi:hypothetical protein
MDYITWLSENKQGQDQPQIRMHSLYVVCQQIADGREARGKRYDLAGLLVVLVLAKLASMKYSDPDFLALPHFDTVGEPSSPGVTR